ncbi:hypothetical protein PIB30_079703, partial [Stylosanthes scabra]|nr:hypothetical protein [Stylosanthes scabra]
LKLEELTDAGEGGHTGEEGDNSDALGSERGFCRRERRKKIRSVGRGVLHLRDSVAVRQ